MTDKVNVPKNVVYMESPEPDRSQTYRDRYGRIWTWWVLDNGEEVGWMHPESSTDGRLWENVKDYWGGSFPWTVVYPQVNLRED